MTYVQIFTKKSASYLKKLYGDANGQTWRHNELERSFANKKICRTRKAI